MGTGGLNIKDYPFAFSLAALFFPTVLSTEPDLSTLFSIMIFGGMIGSILTIINPVGRLIKSIYYILFKKRILKQLRKNVFIKKVIEQNFYNAISASSISYETDKIVGMFYFLVILAATIDRLGNPDFVNLLQLSQTNVFLGSTLAKLGFFSVAIVMSFHIYGVHSVSHLGRIRAVTVLLTGNDFAILSDQGTRFFGRNFYKNAVICSLGLKQISKIEKPNIKFKKFKEKFDLTDFPQTFRTHGVSYNPDKVLNELYEVYVAISDLTEKYATKIEDIVPWFNTSRYPPVDVNDAILSQLQASIESRDWYNAGLKSKRIINNIEGHFVARPLSSP